MDYQSEHLYKVILIGSMSVGKTSLMQQYAHDKVSLSIAPTVGVEFATRSVKLRDGNTVKCQLWDTAGQERYRAVCSAHYKRAMGALIVYDITNRSTFEELDNWIQSLLEKSSQDIQVVLVGNKLDMV